MITPTRPWSHLPLDILQNAACARRTVELDYGHTQRRNGLPHVRGDEPFTADGTESLSVSTPRAWG